MAKKTGGVIVTGHKELDKTIASLEAKVQKKVARSAMRKATKSIIMPAAKSKVPVASGALRKAIKVRAIKRSRSRIGVEVVAGDGFFKGDQYYSGMVEFGTKKQRAQPFLRPAGYENEPRVRRLIEDDIRQALKELGK